MLDDGIYSLDFVPARNGSEPRPHCSALAMLRDGKILGSDMRGSVFDGVCTFDAAAGSNRVRVRWQVPPAGELITGFAAGPKGALIEIAAEFKRPAPRSSTVVEIEGRALEVRLEFIGPLPIPLVSSKQAGRSKSLAPRERYR